MNEKNRNVYGRQVIENLAAIWQQLYLVPGKEGEEQYPDIVQLGKNAESRDLSHFRTSEKDSMEYLLTPAGEVLCVSLNEREDFVTFLRIMANRCKPVEILDTQGASIIDGVINWEKIRVHKEEFLKEEKKKGNLLPDWNAEFSRFTADRNNFRDAIIVLSSGPYSAVSASKAGIGEEEWIRLSYIIRKYHECTHFICRRKYPEKKDAVWDELVADAVGIVAAFGKYDANMEKLFLGTEGNSYVGGRLKNYVPDMEEDKKQQALDELAARISVVLDGFTGILANREDPDPYETAVILEESMDELWH